MEDLLVPPNPMGIRPMGVVFGGGRHVARQLGSLARFGYPPSPPLTVSGPRTVDVAIARSTSTFLRPLGCVLHPALCRCAHAIPEATPATCLRRLVQSWDEALLDLLGWLAGPGLAAMRPVSKACYVFAEQEPLWKDLVLDRFRYQHSWQHTYVTNASSYPSTPSEPVYVGVFPSDYLHHHWICSSLSIPE
eukprot:gene8598-7845_t